MKIKRTIVATRDNEQIILTVTHEGRPLTCPLKQPIPVQNQFGSMNFIEHNCSSKCIGFDLTDNENGQNYFICSFFGYHHMIDVIIDNGINEIEGEKFPKILKLD